MLVTDGFFKSTLFNLFLLVFCSTYASSAITNEKPFKDIRVIASFSNKAEAEKLLNSLVKRYQNVRVLTHHKKVNLKSINVGLYPNRKAARAVIAHLASNNIEAFLFRRKSGSYRVHTGSMQGEDHYWERFELLLSLGYKRIHTALKPIALVEFLVVRDLVGHALPAAVVESPITVVGNEFSHTFLSARFKGEFYAWRNSGEQSSNNYFSASLNARTKYRNPWDFNYGFRLDAQEQPRNNDILTYEVQPLPIYFRIKQANSNWRIGLIEGRWDERKQTSLSDRLSSKMLTRYLQDDEVIDRRRPIIGARWQFNQSQHRLDIIVNPVFRPAKLPGFGGIWHPVNRTNGTILGIRPTTDWQELVKKGSFGGEIYQLGGMGIRMSQQIGQRTRATTIQYARRSAPYYELNPDIQRLISTGSSVDAALAATTDDNTFAPRHPYSAILTWEEFGEISRVELAVFSNVPYTTNTYQMKTAVSLEWELGFVYPTKNNKTHFSSFFIGRWLNTRDDILDRKVKLGLKGDAYRYFSGRHWKVGVVYQADFDQFSLYLNPKISYEQSKHLKISLYSQWFSGVINTDNGYYKDNSLIALNWQAVF